MSSIPSQPSILLHPVSSLQNLLQTVKIITHSHSTVPVERKSDGLVVEMRKPLNPDGRFPPFLPIAPARPLEHTKFTLPAGHRRKPHNLALPCAIDVEKDLAIPMRDGVKIYADVYCPANTEGKVPTIMVWGPYGKEGNSELFMDDLPERLGVKKDHYSGYENFEGPDPAYWCARGYAVVHVDQRGSWNSEGNMYFWGNNDEDDGYNTVEFLAQQPWCNGKVGMAGNSWLAISQWFIASSQPPSLAAIAPWEGHSDAYRDSARRGGAPEPIMSQSVAMLCPGRGMQEDHGAMIEKNEFWNSYWEDKRAKLGRVKCPAYVLASYTSKLHGQGSIRSWREIASKEKWLRVHPQFEWADWLNYQDDLLLFFDHYLKSVPNNWSSTPPVRRSLLIISLTPPSLTGPIQHFHLLQSATKHTTSTATPKPPYPTCLLPFRQLPTSPTT